MANKDIDIHPTAICATEDIGPGTTVGPYVTIDANVTIGAGCTIGEGVSVRDGAVVGDRVTIGPGSRIAGNTKLGDDSCVHPNVVFEQTRLIEPLAISSRAGNIEIGPSFNYWSSSHYSAKCHYWAERGDCPKFCRHTTHPSFCLRSW